MYTYVCIHICTCIYICTCIHVCTCIHICTCIQGLGFRVQIYTCMYIYMHVYICVYDINIYLCMYASMYLCMYLCIHVSMYLCIYVSMCVCIYLSIYVCMHAYIYSLDLPTWIIIVHCQKLLLSTTRLPWLLHIPRINMSLLSMGACSARQGFLAITIVTHESRVNSHRPWTVPSQLP